MRFILTLRSPSFLQKASLLSLYDKARNWFTPPMLVCFVIFGTLPLWIVDVGLYDYIAVEILIWIIFALGFNLLLGYTGLPSFGHGAFLGIGGYGFGWFAINVMPNLWLALAFGIIVTAILGGLSALFVSHRRGIYFALLTLAIGQVFFFVASKWTSLTNGEDGMLGIPRPPADFGFVSFSLHDNTALYYLVFGVFVVTVIVLWRLTHSPFGKVIRAIKQNEMRVGFLGYNVVFFKWVVFTVSCAVAGLAGGMYAMLQQGAYVEVMALKWSGIIVLMTLIGGGMVSFWGPVIGTVVFFLSRDLLGAYTETWLLWYGLMFMVLVMFKPEGIAGMWQDGVAYLKKRRGAGTPPVAAKLARK